jgi:hypothetical protein
LLFLQRFLLAAATGRINKYRLVRMRRSPQDLFIRNYCLYEKGAFDLCRHGMGDVGRCAT